MSIRLLAAALIAAATLQTQPTIRSGVDLIRLDVSVVDKSGRPIPDLRPEDFTVRIDGAERPVSFATFYGTTGASTTAPALPAGRPPSFVTNVATSPGRVMVFVADLDSMTAGYEKVFFDAAAGLLDTLKPADSVGLVALPGRSLELTRDHESVRGALKLLRGSATTSFQRYAITVEEAEAFSKPDNQTINTVFERECRRGDVTCPREVMNEAQRVLFDANRRITELLTTLTSLNDRLRFVEAPKSLVLLSAGLGFTEDGRTRFRDLERHSAEAGVSTFVVHLDQPDNDASRSRPAPPRGDLKVGLQNIAGVTNGEYYAGVGRAKGVFDRIRVEISNTYQLGIKSVASDADGKTHKIDVRVNRPNVTVKSRKELAMGTAPPPTRSPVDVLAFPTPFAEAPLAATAYTTRGEETDTLKVIFLMELLGPQSPEPSPSYAVTIANAKGQEVFTTADKTSPSDVLGSRAITGIQLPPGQYRLRAAVIDAAGRPGSVDMPLTVGLRQAGPVQTSDLIVGASIERFIPANHLPAGTPVTALLELYAADPLQLDVIGVELELRKENDPVVVGHADAPVAKTDLVRRRIASGEISTTGLAPGRYDLSAIVRQGQVPASKVTRTIVIKAAAL